MQRERFLKCGKCGNIVVVLQTHPVEHICCGEQLSELTPHTDEDHPNRHIGTVTFEGGLSKVNLMPVNLARVMFGDGDDPHPSMEEHHIEWVYLKTTFGSQIKYLKAGHVDQVVFALSEKDAYSYCSREVCLMGQEYCAFLCKRGFTVYLYCNKHGLFKKDCWHNIQ